MMIFAIIDGIKPFRPSGHAQVFVALGCVISGDLILNEDSLIRALRDAGAAVDAGVRIDVVPRPLIDWLAWHDAFHRTDIYTSGVSQAQAGDDMGHFQILQ
jgi:hypothetical protein